MKTEITEEFAEDLDPIEKEDQSIDVYGARVNNLKNIDVHIPRNELTVITGLSGSGKSSLAFDTIYAEGQRRYIETFSAYARHFMGNVERPDVDKISGLSPVISIEQKTTNRNPRSTVGTVTEIYDFFRLLYARASEAFSYVTGEKMVKYSDEMIQEMILKDYEGKPLYMLSPLVRGRKGHYKELFEKIRKKGYLNVHVDGEMREITPGMKLDRYKNHDIEVVVDKLVVKELDVDRLLKSIDRCMNLGDGVMMVLEKNAEKGRFFSRHLMCPTSGISYNEPAPYNFSFNTPKGACPRCNGLGVVNEVDVNKIIPDRSKSISKGGIEPLGDEKSTMIFWQLSALGEKLGFTLNTPLNKMTPEAIQAILYGTKEKLRIKNKALGQQSNFFSDFEGVVHYLDISNTDHVDAKTRRWAMQYFSDIECPECHGDRLNKEALQFKIDHKNIADVSKLDLIQLSEWVASLETKMNKRQRLIAEEILKEIRTRLSFLLDVGLGYLSLGRTSISLSGGESQRIRLATQIGSQLVNVLYILDEPSIGLHPQDNRKLIHSLKNLRDIGNSVIVVEHDEEMMRESDYIVDIGPKAGRHGGEVVFQGTPKELLASHTLTADYLNHTTTIEIPKVRRVGKGQFIKLYGASGHNLKNVNLTLPLGIFVGVSGVSGSGKSTLINKTLQPILSSKLNRAQDRAMPYDKIEGLENVDKVVCVDQSPIGRTSRSNPATYTGVFTDIRNLFASLPEAQIRGYKSGRFSFNTKGGRCEVCQGHGYKTIEMNFLPDVTVPCTECQGKRYNRETLEVRFKGKSIADVLDMTINEAVEFFENMPRFVHKIQTLQDVGLGYIKLGQASTTLSGGESQRIKLATELSKRDTGMTVYLLDEPTTGLHFEDIKVLLSVLNRLVGKGNTVVVIEHNLDVLKSVDYLIDMGPKAGREGGEIVAVGTPEEVIKNRKSPTGPYLKQLLDEAQDH